MDPTVSDTYRKIATRLKMLRPQIDLDKCIAFGPKPDLRLNGEKAPTLDQLKAYGVAAANTTLDGVTFIPRDWMDLLTTLRIALTLDGKQAFAEGKSPEKPAHWALDASMAATIGKGFREIWRPKTSDRPFDAPLSMKDLPGRRGHGWSESYSSRFGKDPEPLDITSLHFAVAPDRVNVHIDEAGFVFEGVDGELAVGPNFGHHTLNELVWKTSLGLPDWMAERMDIIAPNSTNEFSRAGVSADIVKRKSYKVTVTGTCAIRGDFDCSGTLSISGTHNIGGSK